MASKSDFGRTQKFKTSATTSIVGGCASDSTGKFRHPNSGWPAVRGESRGETPQNVAVRPSPTLARISTVPHFQEG